MTLTEFLLARIAETQAAAEGFHSRDCYLFVPDHMQADPPECDCGVPACVLADCEAKRRIVEMHSADHECTAPGDGYAGVFAADGSMNACPTMVALGTIYADHPDYHPDYREEWKP